MAHKKHVINGDLSANPVVAEFDVIESGLTKREAFAMAAMQGLLSTEQGCNQRNMIIAERAVEIADALLKELS